MELFAAKLHDTGALKGLSAFKFISTNVEFENTFAPSPLV